MVGMFLGEVRVPHAEQDCSLLLGALNSKPKPTTKPIAPFGPIAPKDRYLHDTFSISQNRGFFCGFPQNEVHMMSRL